MKKLLSLALAGAMCATALTGCGSRRVSESANPDKEASLTVMTVGDEKVSSEELASFLCYEKNIYENYYSSYLGASASSMWSDETLRTQVEESAYNEICYGYAIQSLAKEVGIKMDKAGKDKINEIKQQYYDNLAQEATSSQEAVSGEEGYIQYINSMGFTSAQFDKLLENSVLLEKLTDYYYGTNGVEKIPESDITDYYNKNYYHVKHILISNTDSDGNERADGGLSVAKEVIAKLQGGASFDDLMKTYNTDTGEPDDGYTFSDNDSFVQEFKDASKALEINKYTTEPVKSTYGYHIIIRLPLSEDTLKAATGSVNGGKIYDEIQESMEDMDGKIDAALEKLKIKKTDDYDKVNLLTYHKYIEVKADAIEVEDTSKSDDQAADNAENSENSDSSSASSASTGSDKESK